MLLFIPGVWKFACSINGPFFWDIEEKFAHKYYSQIGLGIDFTARDIQEECKAKGLPWEKSKGFDGSAQISKIFIDKSNLDLNNISFNLEKNGEIVQKGNSADMIFHFDTKCEFRFCNSVVCNAKH